MIGIYKITNTINGKVYIGQSINIEKRWGEHKWDSSLSRDCVLYKALNKYGVDNFSFELIMECEEFELDELEMYYIYIYRSFVGFKDSNGYNMTLGGRGGIGKRTTKETKEKISKSLKGRIVTEETRRKIGEKSRGRKHTEESKEKNRIAHLGRKGHKPSEEHKKRISEAQKGKVLSEEAKQKLREANKGAKNPNAKKVICDGVVYDCIRECADAYGVNQHTMRRWLMPTYKMKQEFKDLGLNYYEENEEDN